MDSNDRMEMSPQMLDGTTVIESRQTLPAPEERSMHLMDTSRTLLELLTLAKPAKPSTGDDEAGKDLDSIIPPAVFRRLLTTLHYRDVATVRHSRRVALMCVSMGKHLGWESRSLKILEIAALLHDVGKIGVPDNILYKPGKLNPDEAHLMTLHYNITQTVLQACRADQNVLNIIRHAQNRYHDTFNRNCSDLPLGSRLLTVADAYDSMSTDQVYRPRLTHDEILKVLHESSGTQFDGNVVQALERWLEAEGREFFQQSQEQRVLASNRGPATSAEALEASNLCRIFSYLHLLENMYDGYYIVDNKQNYRVWSRGMETLIGQSTSDLLSTSREQHPIRYADDYGSTLPRGEQPIQRVLRDGRTFTGECSIQHVDGQWIRVEVQCIPIWDNDQQLQGIAEIYRNLSRGTSHPMEFRELKIAATRDPLTSVNNRGEIEAQLIHQLNKFSTVRPPVPFSVIFLDVDHFKSINDSFGHDVGDQVLIETARMLQMETYSGEQVGRYGGEEFVVIAPETNLEQAFQKAERLRTAISRLSISELKGRNVTASFGVAEAEFGDSVESILRRADQALYRAKHSGRNCTRSLTQLQLLNNEDEPVDTEVEATPSFIAKGMFEACVASNMVVYKLSGFVDEFHARIVDVSPNRAVLRLGHKGLFPFWKETEHGKPVQVELDFGDHYYKIVNGRRSSVPRVQISYLIKPLGWVRDHAVFQSRAARVLKDLRAFFAAE